MNEKTTRNCVNRLCGISSMFISSICSGFFLNVIFIYCCLLFFLSAKFVLTTNTDSVFLTSFYLKVYDTEKKHAHWQNTPNHCCEKVKRKHYPLRKKVVRDLVFFFSLLPQRFFVCLFVLLSRLIKRYDGKRFDTTMFSLCVGFSLFFVSVCLVYVMFLFLLLSFCTPWLKDSWFRFGFLSKSEFGTLYYCSAQCSSVQTPLKSSFSAYYPYNESTFSYHGCWFLFYLSRKCVFFLAFFFLSVCFTFKYLMNTKPIKRNGLEKRNRNADKVKVHWACWSSQSVPINLSIWNGMSARRRPIYVFE